MSDDIRDPETAERLADLAPDELLKRREFLQRTALAAGLATTAGLALPADTLVAEAAKRARRTKLPAPKDLPIDHVVVIMMENRSFDHYLGWMPGADGRQAGLTYTDRAGKAHQTRRLTPDFQGCGHPDPDHSWKGGREQLNGGKCDGFLRSGGNDEFAIGYYAEGDLGFIQDAAKTFTVYDRFFCSIMASTFPNREYMHAATSYGMVNNTIPFESRGFPDTTIFRALKKKGIDATYFYSDVPVSALWGTSGLDYSQTLPEFYTRAAAGTLPALSFVDPNFGAVVGEGLGTSGDEHPHGDVRVGQAFMSDVCHAVMESPNWPRTAVFITYDEWGGFFDHVRPPRVPDDRNDRNVDKDYGLMGFRIPALCLSPWARRGHVSHTVFGFESILKLVEYRWGLKPLTRRDAYAHNIGHAFDFASKPRLENPGLPDPQAIAGLPCPPGGGEGEGPQREGHHDLMELATSGYLEHLGHDFKLARMEDIFRSPDGVRRNLHGEQ